MSSRAAASIRPGVALYRSILASSLPARLGRVAVWLVAAISAAIASGMDHPRPALDTIETGLLWALWLGVGPLAWSLARDSPHAAGLAAMLSLAGLPTASTGGIRAVEWRAAVAEMAMRLALPAMAVFLVVGIAVQPWLLLGVLLAVLFAIAAALTLATVALLCRTAAAGRGRTLFVAVVVLPWALADVFGLPQLSLPGALAALLAELRGVLEYWALGYWVPA